MCNRRRGARSGRDGKFELEHDRKVPVSTINAYVSGTGTRTPVQVGGWDGQDIVSPIVGGATKQKSAVRGRRPRGSRPRTAAAC